MCEPAILLGYEQFKVASLQEPPLNQSDVSGWPTRYMMFLREETTAVTNGPVRADLNPAEETTASSNVWAVAIIGDLACSVLAA